MPKDQVSTCTRSDYLDTIWDALQMVREDCIPEGDESYDEQWDEITSAMAFITEDLDGKIKASTP